jgi:double-strand break repair protein MRE11
MIQVNALIDKANASWDERNAEAVERGEVELPRMLPLIRLKVIVFGVFDYEPIFSLGLAQ